MTDLREAAEMALEALWVEVDTWQTDDPAYGPPEHIVKALLILGSALRKTEGNDATDHLGG